MEVKVPIKFYTVKIVWIVSSVFIRGLALHRLGLAVRRYLWIAARVTLWGAIVEAGRFFCRVFCRDLTDIRKEPVAPIAMLHSETNHFF